MKINTNRFEEYKDNFNIYNLITKIDKNYRLCFDKIKKQFSVINIAKNNHICLNFNNFSLNIIKLLQITRVENSQNLFNFIDENNLNVYEKNKQNCINSIADAMRSLNEFSKRTNSISKTDINKIIKDTYA